MISAVRSNVESYLRRNTNDIVFNAVKVIGIGVLLGISYVQYKILCLVFPGFISLTILGYLLHRFLYMICTIGAFPGSTWYWRRNIENQFQRMFVTRMRKKISSLRTLVEYLLEERAWNNFIEQEELIEVRETITTTLHNFHKQLRHKTLNHKQHHYMEEFAELEQLLNETRVASRADMRSCSLWSFLDGRDSITTQARNIICFEDKSKGHILLHKCAHLESKLIDIIEKKPMRDSFKRWLTEDSFGTLDQLREELDNRYKCKPIALKVEKGVVIDGMLLYDKADDFYEDEDESNIPENRRRKRKNEDELSEGTIIFCCPNAGYYEYMYCDNQWIELYLRNGWNVLLWNYRGYGRSTGKPDPNSFRRDGEAIVDFLRHDLKMKKIGVHGESLGGIVTTHIARAKNIDYMCADRTFTSLSKVVEISFGKNLAKIFRLVTLWDDQISYDFAESKCFKIITFDPKDEIIHLLSSLKYGVTSTILNKKLGYKIALPNNNIYQTGHTLSPYRLVSYSRKLAKAITNEYTQIKAEQDLANSHIPLSYIQSLALFSAFHRVSELFIAMSSLQAISGRRKTSGNQQRPSSDNNFEERPGPKLGRATQPGKVGGSLDASIDASLQKVIEMQGVGLKGPGPDENASFISGGLLNSSSDSRNALQDDNELEQSTKIGSYIELFNQETQTSDEVIDLLVKICAIFEDLEAGGVYISDIMSYKDDLQFPAFQHFIQSFEIWGSSIPFAKSIQEEANDTTYYQNNAKEKLKDFSRRVERLLQKQRRKSLSRAHSRLVTQILEDLELINSLIQQLSNRLEPNQQKTSFAPTNDATQSNILNQEDIELELANHRETKSMLRTSIAYSDIEAGSNNNYSTGFLLPLTCGHNGIPRPHEIKYFEYLFRNAKLMD